MTKNSFKKIDLSKKISKELGLPVLFSKKITEDLIEIFSYKIKYNSLSLKNFGTFKLNEKRERLGRNPKTKEEFLIKKRKSISFKVSKKLILEINNSV